MSDAAGKYDKVAETYSTRYGDARRVAATQVRLITEWGRPVTPGSRILELGCADGLVTAELARRGFLVTAVDVSPRMIEVADRRLRDQGLKAELCVGDIGDLRVGGDFAAVLGVMRTFFQYARDPRATLTLLSRLAPKVVVDVNPRENSVKDCVRVVREGGFARVEVRADFVPTHARPGSILRSGLHIAERVPGLRDAILRIHFVQVIKGER